VHVIVVGAGAIGSYYAAKLSAENDVTLIARRREQVDAIERDGVRITGLEETVCRVAASARVPAIESDTLVVLTTKVYDSAEAIRPIVSLIKPDTVILCLQNGLDSERMVKELVGDRCRVLRGITDFGVIFVEPGRITLKAYGPTFIEASVRSPALADMFTRCQLRGRVAEDIEREVWRKTIVNCVINPLTAMTGMEVGWVADERLDRLKQHIVDECLAVAAYDGVTFDMDFTKMLNDTYRPSRNLSSMYQDLTKGKRTEIDYMNGAVAERGRRHGVACPINEALVAIVKALE
jgi:2-dehydropantoate 2-reductase